MVGKAKAEERDKHSFCRMAHLAERLTLRTALSGCTEAKHLSIGLKFPTYGVS